MKHRTDKTFDLAVEAAQWVMRLESNAPEIEEFERWLSASPAHQREFFLASMTDAQLDSLVSLKDKHRQPPSRWLTFPQMAAAALAVIGIGIALLMLASGPKNWVYTTDVGGRKQQSFADGSVVTLNTNTSISGQFDADSRPLTLLKGEAQFEVADDPRRPFAVHAGRTVVTALGTKFVVRRHDDGSTDVVVWDGKVRIDPSGRKESREDLTAGELAVVSPEGVIVKRTMNDADRRRHLAWLDGKIYFERAPLSAVIQEFNRYNRRHMTIRDPAIGDMEISVGVPATDVHSFIETLSLQHIQAIDEDVQDASTPIILVSKP